MEPDPDLTSGGGRRKAQRSTWRDAATEKTLVVMVPMPRQWASPGNRFGADRPVREGAEGRGFNGR